MYSCLLVFFVLELTVVLMSFFFSFRMWLSTTASCRTQVLFPPQPQRVEVNRAYNKGCSYMQKHASSFTQTSFCNVFRCTQLWSCRQWRGWVMQQRGGAVRGMEDAGCHRCCGLTAGLPGQHGALDFFRVRSAAGAFTSDSVLLGYSGCVHANSVSQLHNANLHTRATAH